MTFLEPMRLLGLIGVAALGIIYIVLQSRRRTYAVRFTNMDLLDSIAPRSPGWRRHVPAFLFLLAAALMVCALAKPARDDEVAKERATVILAIDTSLSMEADDVTPNRIEGAKSAAITFLDTIPERINVGLVTFNGIATVRVPPTQDHDAIARAINTVELGESTAIGEALFASIDAVGAQLNEEEDAAPARIVLMSDGSTTTGRPDELGIEAAVEAQIPVSTIAFGTANGVINIPEEGLVPVPVDTEALSAIASGTGGDYYTAATTTELESIYANIGSSIGFEVEQVQIILWFVFPAMILLLLSSATSLLWFSRLP